MAATIGYAAPRWIPNGAVQVPNPYQVALNNAQTLVEGDFAILSSNKLSKAAANAAVATIAGIVRFGNTDSYGGVAGSSRSSILGPNQAGNALIPGTNNNAMVFGFTPNMAFEMSLNTATTLAVSLIGAQAGINYDATSGYFFVDTTQVNKIFTIVQLPGGPDALYPSFQSAGGAQNGVLGDSGGRVIVTALTGAALQ
ncbi:MAG: hypothetical protein KGL39_27200 [Patescibacteria group bacterium]|nr:hypothetical protein [Patescibacteria group bacterium]